MNAQANARVEVNGRSYPWPRGPVVVVCIDGSEPGYEGSDGGGYMERAMAAGQMPWLSSIKKNGYAAIADVSCQLSPIPTTCRS